MKIDVVLRIEAPPAVVFRFYTSLDHLRFICTKKRHEWSPMAGVVIKPGLVVDVRIRQGPSMITVRFRTVRVEPDRFFEDEFVSFPVRGAKHTVSLEPRSEGLATQLENVLTWDPPWYLRRLVERHGNEQRSLFIERQENAKRIIEAVYKLRGESAFEHGIFQDALAAGFEPVAKADRT